jgi:hypothetical protein
VNAAAKDQVLTTRESWQGVKEGSELRFNAILAPGHEDTVSCVQFWGERSGTCDVKVVTCGAQLEDIIAPGKRRSSAGGTPKGN